MTLQKLQNTLLMGKSLGHGMLGKQNKVSLEISFVTFSMKHVPNILCCPGNRKSTKKDEIIGSLKSGSLDIGEKV